MKEYLNGWKNLDEVEIPPIEQSGFAQDIMIRDKVEPLEEENIQTSSLDDDSEDATVLLRQTFQRHVYIKQIRTEQMAEVKGTPFIIGKSLECDYVVRDNATVSRRHAQILEKDGGYWLEDLHSSNYTMIEEQRIYKPEKLSDGKIFQLSDEKFQFVVRME